MSCYVMLVVLKYNLYVYKFMYSTNRNGGGKKQFGLSLKVLLVDVISRDGHIIV